ncbi:MAG: ATP-binding protein [Verrucomicrobiae bacterium]|nr:ATP-binding protein [Myxococcales bacterium]NJM54617.1 ATP-binding protein [Verrucomicrobiae bacterium]
MTDLAQPLRSLGLRGVAEQLDDLITHATEKRLSPRQVIEQLVQVETSDRAQRSLDRRLARSKIGRFKPMADFDWAWPTRIDRDLVEAALGLSFIDGARNVILVAPHGLGKTMIAQNIAQQAILRGASVIFTTASQLLLDLSGTESARGLDRRLKHYGSVGLLCIDEIGYLPYDNRNADLLFQLVNRRYEKRSLVLTTNLAFSDWPTIFPNATSATALIDRVVHHADIIPIEGSSYRLRESKEHKAHRTRSSKKSQ